MFDTIIIGKGPAGLSAGIYTSMANLNTLIIGKDSEIEKTTDIKNYFGFSNSINGKNLKKTGTKKAFSVCFQIINYIVIKIENVDNVFEITTTNHGIFQSKTILLATGNSRNKVQIENIDKFEGRGVSYCTTCDGFFFRNKKVGVIGNTNYTINEADELLNYTQNIHILTNGKPLETTLRADTNVNTRKIGSIEGEQRLEYIVYDNGEKERFDGLFIAINYPTTTDFIKKLGIETKNNLIKINEEYMTNIKGMFAAGDLVNEFKQISTAVASGAIAGKNIIKYCKRN